MIEIVFSEKSIEKTHTYELTCTATGGSPFVKNDDNEFLNIASPADMLLLPDSSQGTGLFRDSEITLIFRDSDTIVYTKDNITEQIKQLNAVTLTDITGATLFTNI